MFRWLFQSEGVTRSFDTPSETQSARDDRKTIGDYADNFLLFDLVMGEVEMAVIRFEIEKEEKEEAERKAERRPDYSWLISGNMNRARKQLSINVSESSSYRNFVKTGNFALTLL